MLVFTRPNLALFLGAALAVTACAGVGSVENPQGAAIVVSASVPIPAVRSSQTPQPFNVVAAADAAVRQANDVKLVTAAYMLGVAAQKVETAVRVVPVPPTARSVAVVSPTASSGGFTSWQCVATAETGGDFSAHGSSYSSAFGMLNQAVINEADSPASAQRILDGTASPQEQIDAASRELARYGVQAWGELTRQKCAR